MLIIENFKKIKKQYINSVKNKLSYEDLNTINNLFTHLKILPKGKLKHSTNVSKTIAPYFDIDSIIAALFHDYIERGGDIDKLPISDDSKDIIKFLTVFEEDYSDSKNIPLDHMVDILGDIEDQEIKNKLILIKLSDRVDNLNRRGKNVDNKYLKKSIKLIKYLKSQYVGDVDFDGLLSTLKAKVVKKVRSY